MAFSFGAPAAGSSTGAGTSLFGGGAANTSTAPKPLFGGFSTPNPQQQPGQQPGSTSLFGAAPAQPSAQAASGGGLFGSSNAAPAGPNPAQPAAPSLFGSFGQNQQQQQQQQGQQGQQQPPATGGGLFGSTTATAPASTGLFGSTAQNNTGVAGGGGGLFGGAATGGFGASQPPKPAGTGLFGSAAQPQQQQQGTGLFGSNAPGGQQQQQQQQQTGGLFGGGFGQQSQQQPQPQGLFASQQQPQQQQQQPSNNMLSGSTMGLQVQPKQEVSIEERMMAVQRSWDTNSPDCRFKYFFYNVVEPGTTYRYGRPAGATDESKWNKALRENPDPDSMVPVLATGWADVKKRVQLQENVASVHQEKIKEITQALAQLTRQTSLSSSIRLTALQQSLTQQLQRLIHLSSLTPQFIPILHSTAFRSEETELKARLDGIKAELDGRAGTSRSSATGYSGAGGKASGGKSRSDQARMLGQVNELWGAVEELRLRKKRVGGGGGAGLEGDAWLADERVLAEIAEILSAQQLALTKLTDVVNNGAFDADVIRQGLGNLPNKPEGR